MHRWGLPPNPPAYRWQTEALARWNRNSKKGIVKVVTGAGKTRLALMAMEQIMRTDETVRVSVVVPTIVLLNQWYNELTESPKGLRLPRAWVGRRGGGHKDSFSRGRRVMIYVIASAREHLGKPLTHFILEDKHFLIVDECQKAGSPKNRKIFDVPKRYSIGLSATPERDDEESWALLQAELGEVFFTYSFKQAIAAGILPPLQIYNYAVPLTADERSRYDYRSKIIVDVRRKLKQMDIWWRLLRRLKDDLFVIRWLAANQPESAAGELAQKLESLMYQRKGILYSASRRRQCFFTIFDEVTNEFRRNFGRRPQIMVFHERISEVDALVPGLRRRGVRVAVDHTELPKYEREDAIADYRDKEISVLLSVKALIEGVNAPATDIGIIVASSGSVRQKIQTMGRVMRKHEGKDFSRIYNIYVENSADEYIFEKMSFESLVDRERVHHRKYVPQSDDEDDESVFPDSITREIELAQLKTEGEAETETAEDVAEVKSLSEIVDELLEAAAGVSDRSTSIAWLEAEIAAEQAEPIDSDEDDLEDDLPF